jgi:transcriptional regulator with XRE-family HTH domain
MKIREAFAKGLKEIRSTKGLTQEDFDQVSSRTYISMLERGEKSPTLDKLEQLASVLKVHPLTLLTLTYMKAQNQKVPETLLTLVERQLSSVRDAMKRSEK